MMSTSQKFHLIIIHYLQYDKNLLTHIMMLGVRGFGLFGLACFFTRFIKITEKKEHKVSD